MEDKYDAEVRIPTTQYGYIHFNVHGTPEEVYALHEQTRRLVGGGAGLSDKEYNSFIDRMLLGEDNHIEEYLKMSQEQQGCVQVIKRALKRIKARE